MTDMEKDKRKKFASRESPPAAICTGDIRRWPEPQNF